MRGWPVSSLARVRWRVWWPVRLNASTFNKRWSGRWNEPVRGFKFAFRHTYVHTGLHAHYAGSCAGGQSPFLTLCEKLS